MRLAAGIAAVFFLASHANAATVLQDFNANPSNLPNGAMLPSNYFPGMTINNALLVYQGPTNPAIAFNYPNGGPSGDFVSNPANFNGDFLGAAGTGGGSAVITFTFNSPVSNISIWLADIDVSESYALTTYDPSSTQIASVTVSSGMPGTGDGIATDISIPGANVKTLIVTPNFTVSTGGYGLDDLQYDAADVPEPSSAAMFALLGGSLSLGRPRPRRCRFP
jgi:hypothetical protein